MDPHKRWSCEQLLEHSYFDNYLIETKREDNKSKSYQAQNMFQNDRKSKLEKNEKYILNSAQIAGQLNNCFYCLFMHI